MKVLLSYYEGVIISIWQKGPSYSFFFSDALVSLVLHKI